MLTMSEIDQRTVLSALRTCGFLESLDEGTLLTIRPAAKRVMQPRNTVIFHAGEPCHGFYIVESGAVRIYKESPDAREHVIHVATEGDCFGEAALFLGTGYPASAAAVRDSALILLRKDEFLDIVRGHPEVALRLMASMATWSHRLVRSIEALTLKDAGARFASYLLSKMPPPAVLPSHMGKPPIVDLGMPKQVLASHLGMTSETLSRLLARFEAEGLVEGHGRKLKILSEDEIRDVAESGRA